MKLSIHPYHQLYSEKNKLILFDTDNILMENFRLCSLCCSQAKNKPPKNWGCLLGGRPDSNRRLSEPQSDALTN